MTTKRTDAQLIESAKKMTIGKDYKIVIKSAEFIDEDMNLPRRIVFKAVEFTANDGKRKFISELFL